MSAVADTDSKTKPPKMTEAGVSVDINTSASPKKMNVSKRHDIVEKKTWEALYEDEEKADPNEINDTIPNKQIPTNAKFGPDGEYIFRKLEDQKWYHAMRPRADIIHLLKEDGDWLVRISDTRGTFEVILTVKGGRNGLTNLSLGVNVNKFFFLNASSKGKNQKFFMCVVDLVEYYMNKKLPGKVQMKRAVIRPAWLIKKSQVCFDVVNDKIGKGNFAFVYKGKFSDPPTAAIDVAVKVAIMNSEDGNNIKMAKDDLMKEAKIMSYFAHDNVIRFFGIACDDPPVMLVMEFCGGGALDSHLTKAGDTILPAERILYAYEIARGMKYLHYKKSIHRDLATRNVLISSSGVLKVADFGLSRMAEELKNENFVKAHIPILWMAPETLYREPKYTEKSDVWSFAVLLFEIYTNGAKPWPEISNFKQIAKYIRKCKMWKMPVGSPPEMVTLVNSIFVLDLDTRPNFAQISETLKNHLVLAKKDISVTALSLNKLKNVKRTSWNISNKNVNSLSEESASQSKSLSRDDTKESD
uniref:Tyrosine-protein kinase n=1 Tax=Rhabditophanes sp. KR3021 TaxID=114890 RepID=A0AC35UEK7_9BILA